MTETRIETYIPLYRKYRPQVFADVVGQEAIVQTLGNAINLNKVAHAYLFCGPRGTGKTSTARIFAKSLNCEQGPTVSPCLQCASCVGITQGNALDVIEFDAASNNGVGDARELIENCQYSSMTGRFKVYIIDEVHMLTPQAFNALLKTLEEPPANVIFIFATTEAHKVLPTIISRCQRFDFNRITTESIVNRLKFIAGQEQIAIDDEAVLMIARHARGGLRDAVGLLDQVSVLSRAQQDKVIGRKDVALFIGTLEEDLLLRLSGAIAERRAADLLNDLSELLNRGIEPIQLLKDLTVHFRNLLLVQAAGVNANPDQLGLPGDYFGRLAEQVKLFPEVEEIPQVIGRLSFVERNIRNSSQPQLWLEVGLIELAYRYDIQLVKDLSDRVTQLEARLVGGAMPAPMQSSAARSAALAAPMPRPQPAAPAPRTFDAAPPVQSTPPRERPAPTMEPAPRAPEPLSMSAVSSAVSAGGGMGALQVEFTQICNMVASLTTRALLQQQAFAISMADDVLVLGCASEPTLSLLKKPDKTIHLQKAVDKFYGRPIRVEMVFEKKRDSVPPVALPPEPMPARPPAPEVVMRPAPPQPVMQSQAPEPFVQQPPMETFASASLPPELPPSRPPEPSVLPSPVAMEPAPPVAAMAHETDDASSEETFSGPIDFAIVPSIGTDPELMESKKHAVELFQGRVLE